MIRQFSTRLLLATIVCSSLCLDKAYCGETAVPADAEQVCVVSDSRITESSGLAFSHRAPDAVWIHNDSGDTARLFLVGLDGTTRGVFKLADTPMPLDWEDMCSFTVEGEPWLLIGDVGDNSTNRHLVTPDRGPERACRLLLLHEPVLKDGPEQDMVPVNNTILYEYEDGPRNCESVAVDMERKEILLVTKSKSTPLDCGVYTIPLTLEAGTSTAQARRIGSLDLPFATAMDIAPDNRIMVIISIKGASIIEREASQTWGDAIREPSLLLALPKREQGETVCFGKSNDELFLNSEKPGQPVWRVTIPAQVAAQQG